MTHIAAITAAVPGSAPPVAYHDQPQCSPPPYAYCEGQLPPQYIDHVNELADDPPDYSCYDVERGSLIDIALAQYAQSISSSDASIRYSMPQQDEDVSPPVSNFSGRIRSFLFYCIALFCGVTWAVFWVCAIGYAIVISFQKVAESLV